MAILPGILIAYLIYRMDKFEKEPPVHLICCFLLGMLATVPSMYLEYLGAELGWEESSNVILLLCFSIVIVGLSEEITKYLFLLAYPYPRSFFNEPMDGIIYAVMIGMGFATLENVLYADRYGMDVIIIRAFTAVPAHGIFAVISGYFVGLAKFNPDYQRQYLALGLVVPVLIHGMYDFFIIQEYYEWMMGLATLILAVSAYWGWTMIVQHQKNSPFKNPEIEVANNTVDTSAITDDIIEDMTNE